MDITAKVNGFIVKLKGEQDLNEAISIQRGVLYGKWELRRN